VDDVSSDENCLFKLPMITIIRQSVPLYLEVVDMITFTSILCKFTIIMTA
jgi:hypothetical protein